MEQMSQKAVGRYMDELERCLRRQGAEIWRRDDGSMDAYYQQKEFGRFYPDGAMSFQGEKSKELKHVHVHLIIFSSDPKEGYLSKQGIRKVKSALLIVVEFPVKWYTLAEAEVAVAEEPL